MRCDGRRADGRQVFYPAPIHARIGQAISAEQRGEEYQSVKALKGFGGHSIVEIVTRSVAGTSRTVYIVRFEDEIYTLHAFQKSKKGIATPQTYK